MSYPIWKTQRAIVGSALLGSMMWATVTPRVLAQSMECPSPQAGEYLILVIAAQEKDREAVVNLLPSDSQVLTCNYLGETVVRIGGYEAVDEANTWAQSIAAQTGLGAFVTRPPQVTAQVPMAPTPTVETSANPTDTPPSSSPTSRSSLPLPNVQMIPAQRVGSQPKPTEIARTPDEDIEEIATPLEIREEEDRQVYLPDVTLPRELALPDYNVLPSISLPDRPPYPVTPSSVPPPVATTYNSLPALPKPISNSSGTGSPPLPVAYNPQLLDEGYAVLVDYFNQPEVAVQLQQTVGADVGLATYARKPYLLVRYTDSEEKANSTLQDLSEIGFLAMVVDSRQVVLLSPVVAPF
ncbi:MAG: hypothetical protein WBB29_14625 [Geitlerinemataceae cyanobacterium]